MFVLLVYGVCSVRAGSACVHAVIRAVIVCLSCWCMLGVTVCAVSIYVRPVIISVCACPVIACACHVHACPACC